MASEGAGKVRSKRYNEHGKPYERRRSIIGMVTDTVKGIFKSSWSGQESVTKDQSPNIQDGNGQHSVNSVQHKSDLNHTHGLSNNLGQSYLQPHATGSLPGPSKVLSSQVPIGMSQILPQPLSRQEPSNFTSEHLPFVQYENKPASLIVNGGDDRSELSECSVSTSGCSSMAPHLDKKDYQHDVSRHQESRIHHMRQELGGSMTPSKEIEARASRSFSVKDTRRGSEKSFLWKSQLAPGPRQPQSPASSNSPSFNISIFGSSSSYPKPSGAGSSHNDSIFYSGKTTFGGASSQKKRKLQETSPPQLTPNKRQVRAKPASSSVGGVSSSSARRILSTLERMSSPLKDARKIPSYNSSLVDSPLSFTPSSFSSAARRRSAVLRTGPTALLKGPPVHAINTPGTVQIAKNYNHPSYLKTTSPSSAPVQTTSPSSCAVIIQTTQSESAPSTSKMGKIKRERGQHYSSKKDEDDMVEVPDLPTDFTLPVTLVPKFDFTPTSITSTPLPSESRTTKPTQRLSSDPFTFSTPIPKSQPEKTFKSTATQNFQFSSPIAIANAQTLTGSAPSVPQSVTDGNQSTGSLLAKPNLNFSFDPSAAKKKSIDKSPATAAVPAPAESEGGFHAAKELKMGSVMDILGGSNSKTSEDCTISPTTSKSAPAVVPENKSLSDLFKKPSGSWECPVCMIQNKADHVKCAACTTAKPGSASSTETKCSDSATKTSTISALSMPIKNSLAEQFKKPEGTWDCDTCMVMNNSAATKCIACQTSKPGFKKATSFTSAGGFKIGPTGGFQMESTTEKDTKSADTTQAASRGFKAQLPSLPEANSANTKPLDGGFKLGTSDTTETRDLTGGFKMGASETNPDAGGFKIETSISSDAAPVAGGFKFGASLGSSFVNKPTTGVTSSTDEAKSDSVSKSDGGFKLKGGLQFGSSNTIAPTGDIKFGQTVGSETETKGKEANNDTKPVGGFKFGESLAKSPETDTCGAKSVEAGFKFGQSLNMEKTLASAAPTVTLAEPKPAAGFMFGGQTQAPEPPKLTFAFGAPATTAVSAGSASEPKSAFGVIPASANTQNSSAPLGVSDTKLSNSVPNFGAVTSDSKSSVPSATPGIFAFGQANKESTSAAFAFGTAAGGATPGSVATNTTSSGVTAPVPAANLSFGTNKPAEQAPVQASTFVFGASNASSAPTASATQQSSTFTFGTAPKPETSSSAPAFNFSASTSATGMFSKPAESAAQPAATSNNMFSFTAKPADSPATTGVPFAFGQSPASTSAAPSATFGAATASASSTFGGFTKSASTPAFGSVGKTTAANNTFGTSTNSATPAFGTGTNTPGFGAPSASTPAPFGAGSTANPPAFGTKSTAAPAFGTTTPAGNAPAFGSASSTTNGFQFGGEQQVNTSSAFVFGQTNQTPVAPANTGFNFGQSAQTSNQPAPFNFGAASPPNSNFQFSAQPSTPAQANPFSVTGTPATQPRRVKKAARKLTRK